MDRLVVDAPSRHSGRGGRAVIAAVATLTALAGLLWHLRRRRDRRAIDRRSAALLAALAPTIDVVVVVLGSGGTVADAVRALGRIGPLPVRSAFADVVAQADGGRLLVDAIATLYDRLIPAYHPMLGAIQTAERDGGALTAMLQSLADDAERARSWQAEAVAQRLSVSLLLPLVIFLLPAAVIGSLVPLVIVGVRHLGASAP